MIDRHAGPVGTTEITDAANALTEAEETVIAARAALADAVRRARNEGVSWAGIGAALGISRQAAQQRFGDTAAVLGHASAAVTSAHYRGKA